MIIYNYEKQLVEIGHSIVRSTSPGSLVNSRGEAPSTSNQRNSFEESKDVPDS